MKNYKLKRNCAHCETPFTIMGSTSRYCSALCMLQYRSIQIGDCWIWRNGREWCGYQITWLGEPGNARAVALAESGTDVKPGSIYSTCGSSCCINPAHLTQDEAQKSPRRKATILTDEQLSVIRRSCESSAALAQRYGVDTTTIQRHRKSKK